MLLENTRTLDGLYLILENSLASVYLVQVNNIALLYENCVSQICQLLYSTIWLFVMKLEKVFELYCFFW